MSGFTKLYQSIIHSTVWREPDHVRIVWITMLAMADREGIVEASVPGLADASRVDMTKCVEALDKLSSPDPYSRTKDFDGRRIGEIDGGWVILNYVQYRAKLTAEDKRRRNAEKQRRWREKQKKKQTEEKVEEKEVTGSTKVTEKVTKGYERLQITPVDPNTPMQRQMQRQMQKQMQKQMHTQKIG